MNNQAHGPPGFERERDRDREREIEEQQHRQRALQQQEDLAHREREHNERQERERQHREQYQPPPPHQSSANNIPIHQPVANRLPSAIHSPSGLLANHGGAPPPPSGPLGAPSGPGNAFGGPLHSETNRQIHHNPQSTSAQLQQQQAFGPGIIQQTPGGAIANAAIFPSHQAQQAQLDAASRLQLQSFGVIPSAHQGHQPGVPALGQGGQQPILNDALSYLDQVKVQFSEHPDVYNRFLDIMKDFKSQAIDTPGVINRVSELFAGHPNLIQGFNTFLPPGYRIECGAGDNPNTIRVTTPMGTTVQSITGTGGRALPDSGLGTQNAGGGGYYSAQRQGGNWQQVPQHSIESPEAVFSPQHQSVGPAYTAATHNPFDAAAAAAHQQQQRGVSQLTNAVATLGHPPRNTQTPTPGQQAMNGGAQPGLEKRGPVEFNHAISYVNKIKNRFQDKPEIYKQFLEILQTYQRESKPIQDVYAQVTHLFSTAPDLLEDFKQFLPESAAQAKVAAAKAAAEEASQNQQPQPPRAEKMPPVGHFSVPASNKAGKRKIPPTTTFSQSNTAGDSSSKGMVQNANGNKRAKTGPNRAADQDTSAAEPTLTPIRPEPVSPTASSGASSEEIAFFDRVKKYISNKQTMNEFLKLCNLFSQDLIDKNVLVHKVSIFIGGNPDLMSWFRAFVNYDGEEEVVDNMPKAPTGRVALSNCRGLGPSYRLLPKRERLKPCSGRDEMCNSVLNDSWASHPTWASEDSGFVAHRKNTYEESLHRIEEERHDYDFTIEANNRVVALLEPIAQSLLSMTPEDRENFRMPVGLGGQSQAIYKRVFKKVYGDKGTDVVADLFRDPCAVLPVVLARIKQKDEEWRFAQREWEKVWGFQTYNMYLRSLDHQGIQVKQSDKKHFSTKHLVDAIKTKHEEFRRAKKITGSAPLYQYNWTFDDQEVLLDVIFLMSAYVNTASQHNTLERRRISDFFEKFMSTFFDISPELIAERLQDIERATPDDDSEEATPIELPNGRGKRVGNGKKNNDLRRGVLDKARNGARGTGRGQKEDSATGSKESTPDNDSAADEDVEDQAEEPPVSGENWASMKRAAPVDTHDLTDDLDFSADQPFARDHYKLWCNQTMFVFVSLVRTVYDRLKEIKDSEDEALEELARLTRDKPARDMGLMNYRDDYYALVPESGESYYRRTNSLVHDFISGEIDENAYQAALRQYYLKRGWRLYTIQDFLKQLARHGATCSSNDVKEKTPLLLDLFYNNKPSKETTYNTEINMRMQAQKYIKDGDLFLVQWHSTKKQADLRWILRDETTFSLDEMERKERWQYYISSYVRIEPTEGVPRNRLHKTVLTRNIPADSAEFDSGIRRRPLDWCENLTLRVCVNTYKIIYRDPGYEFQIFTDKSLDKNPETNEYFARERLSKVETIRTDRFREKFEMNNSWMKGLDRDEVANINNDFKKWMEEGIVPGSASTVPSADTDMTS